MHASRIAIIGIGGIVAASAVFGSAAGLTNTVAKLGGSQAVVASCDVDGVTTDWTSTYDATVSEYTIATVTVAGIDDPGCLAAVLKVRLTRANGAVLGTELTTTIAAAETSHTFTLGANVIKASDVYNAAIVFVGP